ncbi:unnamed protein product [Notodromas monacha]|uniref:GOLD domain-containing protein n=1 Tax=Notodromas monacha TaxID=399045 RepID=A0A7R9BPL9_9CRUS|nr:unnamed protein product [Notodromas monacha]CAG0918491.1 unnamed protein product [Notodromas monacha]
MTILGANSSSTRATTTKALEVFPNTSSRVPSPTFSVALQRLCVGLSFRLELIDTRVVDGALVPKALYMSEEEMEKDREHFPLCEDSIYHSVSIARGQVHEVVINNEDVGSVICWDFDVMKQAVIFSVLRTRLPLPPKNEPSKAVHSINPLASDSDHRTVFEKGWKEGTDYFLVEDAITCHDGESIQGSHATEHKGTYVLQWKCVDSQASSFAKNVTELIDSITITHHKAKVMYFHEVLTSQDLNPLASDFLVSADSFLHWFATGSFLAFLFTWVSILSSSSRASQCRKRGTRDGNFACSALLNCHLFRRSNAKNSV